MTLAPTIQYLKIYVNFTLESNKTPKEILVRKLNMAVNVGSLGILNVLTMLYNTQIYCVSAPCPSSRILKTRKHNVSEN
jgi:hypothetical protein